MSQKLKTLLLLSLMWGSLMAARAQLGEYQRRIMIGVNAGATMNQVGFDPSIAQKWMVAPKYGVTFQLMSERYFNAYCALQLELNYVTLGWKEDVRTATDEKLPDRYERQASYIRFPMLAKIGWGKPQRGCMGFLMAGPEVGFLVRDHAKRSNTWTMKDGHPDRPNGMFVQYDMDIERKFDYGISAGAGIECNFGKNNISLDARYYYGLSDLFDNGKRDVFSRSNNGAIVMTLNYNFVLGR